MNVDIDRKILAAIAIVVVVALVAVVGAMYLQDGPDEPVYEYGPDAGGPHDVETPNDPAEIESADDPGPTTYPENPESAEDKMLGTREMRDNFHTSYQRYRANHDLMQTALDRTGLVSVARAHSFDMYNHEYVDTHEPDGSEFTTARYDTLQTNCVDVDRIVRTKTVTVVNAEGDRLEVTSEGVASDILAEMLDEEETREMLLSEHRDYNGYGVGFYLVDREAEDGSTVVDVYMTMDFCHQWSHDRHQQG